MAKHILITKASGETAPFSSEKLRDSLRRAGASEKVIQGIVNEVKQLLYPGINTKEIYRKAYALLRKASSHTAAKYKLKKAIMELGPTGFPFEKYVGEILKYEGFQIEVGKIVKGLCVQHEVDVLAQKEARHYMVECKFHSDQGRKCTVKIPLYIYARFLDVEKAWKKKPGHVDKIHQGWLVTNTRFTEDAEQYGTCAGLNMVSWNFPNGTSLRERIDRSGLHPLTCLTTLTKKEKQILLDKGIVLCKELLQHETWLTELGVSYTRITRILKEAKFLCDIKTPTHSA